MAAFLSGRGYGDDIAPLLDRAKTLYDRRRAYMMAQTASAAEQREQEIRKEIELGW